MVNFIEKFSKRIVEWCSGNDASEEKKEILIYGYSLILENLYKLLVLLLIAVFTGTLWQSILIIASLSLLGSFAGGIHCRTSLGCTACMVAVWGAGLLVSRIEIPVPVLVVMAAVIGGTILRYAPQCTRNNPITDPHIRRRKRVGAIVVMTVLMAGGVLTYVYWDRQDILNMILTSMLMEVFSILLLLEKEDKGHEEDESERDCGEAW